MAETDHHRDLMFDLIKTLDHKYVNEPMVYVSGNLLIFYEPGNRRRHVAPDVFVVKGVPKRRRPNYLVWEERRPNAAIELTSSSTRKEDEEEKFELYQNVLRIPEYFLFDPFGDYLKPPMKGYRLRQGKYAPIRPVNGRLPSKELGLHLERSGTDLRLYDPSTGLWLPTPLEMIAQAELGRRQAEAENERLRREIDELSRRLPKQPGTNP